MDASSWWCEAVALAPVAAAAAAAAACSPIRSRLSAARAAATTAKPTRSTYAMAVAAKASATMTWRCSKLPQERRRERAWRRKGGGEVEDENRKLDDGELDGGIG